MNDGYWVVSVERTSGRATTTSHLFSEPDEAYRHALDAQTPDVCMTVVSRRPVAQDRNHVNRC
jgi:hypothetical protein